MESCLMDKDALAKQIGDRIRQRRMALNMTQAELAGADMTKSFVSQVEKGQTMPSIETLVCLAGRLGRPPSYFIDSDPPEHGTVIETVAKRVGVDPEAAVRLLEELLRGAR